MIEFGGGHGRGRRSLALWLAIGVSATLPAAAAANPGDLDPSFSEHGKFSMGGSSANAVAVQPDGKTLVLAGSSLRRLSLDGNSDRIYGKKGSAELGFPESYNGNSPADVVALPDGSSLVSGYVTTREGGVSVSVVRHLANGAVDKSFGAGGAATVALAGTGRDSDLGTRLAVSGDGRILVGGGAGDAPQVTRLMPNGVPDPGFNGGTPVAVNLGPEDVFSDVAVAPDGKVVVQGIAAPGGGEETDLAVARLNADGTPDAGFSGDGVAVADLGGRESGAGVAVQPDGKIVVVTTLRLGCREDRCQSSDMAVVRFDVGGPLDPGFGKSGVTVARPPADLGAEAAGVALAADGKIVVAGGGYDFVVARLEPNGVPDVTFGSSGFTWTSFRGIYPAYATGLALTPANDIVVAGFIYLEEAYDELAIARYLGSPGGEPDIDADGVLDPDDDCSRVFGTIKSGCPFVSRKLKLKYDEKKNLVTGRISTSQRSGEPLNGYLAGTTRYCAGNSAGSVVLFEKRGGPDRRVAVDRKPDDLEFRVKSSGEYYARVKEALVTAYEPDGPVELCGADKSKPLRIG